MRISAKDSHIFPTKNYILLVIFKFYILITNDINNFEQPAVNEYAVFELLR